MDAGKLKSLFVSDKSKDGITGTITDASYFGETTYYKVKFNFESDALTVSAQNSFSQLNYKIGDKVQVETDLNSVVAFS